MLRLFTSFVIAGLLIGCQQRQPETSTDMGPSERPAEPVSVKTINGIEHGFYRHVNFVALLQQLPAGSVDYLAVLDDEEPYVIVLVKVPKRMQLNLSKVQFETTFTAPNGETIKRQWAAAKNRKSGEAAALFSLPPSINHGVTEIIQSRD